MPGSIGVVDGVAMYTGDGSADGISYLDVGGVNFSNLRAQMTVVAVEEDSSNPAGVGLRFRRSDEDNWWEFGMNTTSTEYVLRKRVGGLDFMVAEPNLTRGNGDILKVEAYEERINCYVNETLVISITDTDLIDNQQVGMRFSAACVDSAVDDFYALMLEEDIRNELTYQPVYEFFIDWDNDGGLNLADFETTTEDFVPFGTRLPDISLSDLYVRSGNQALRIEWNQWNLLQFDIANHGFDMGQFGGDEYSNPPNPFKFDQAGQGFDDGRFAVTKVDTNPTDTEANFIVPGAYKVISNLIPGREYTLKAWVYVPSNSTAVSLGVQGISGASTSTVENEWERLTYTYIATDTEHTVLIYSAETNPGSEDECFVDEVMNIGAYEDISCYVIGDRGAIDWRYGRDQARSLASISPGEVTLELDNESQIFSPDNPGSVLAGYLAPGKPVLIRATYNNQTVNLFHGFVDNYELHPNEGDRSVMMSAMDVLQYLSNAQISTNLYPSIQTGEAIEIILDKVNWPKNKRSIDQGASTIRWWWLEDSNGLEAVQNLVEAEGMPSIAYVDAFGNFVFRSRHHRLLKTASKSIQAYIRSCAEFDEPNFSSPITYDIGWKDIINQINVEVDELMPQPLDVVWSQEEDWITILPGDTYTANIKADNAFMNAVIPSVANKDIVLKEGTGSISSVNLTSESGQSATLTITAGVDTVVIKKLQLRANPIRSAQKKKVLQEDSTSVATYGPQTEGAGSFKLVNVNDMESIAQVILGQRSERLAVVHIRLNNGHPIRISHILNRRLSDRIHIEEMLQTFMDDDYFIEVLEHSLDRVGTSHVMTIGCEKARDQLVVEEEESPFPIFTFDVAGQGFDDGYFAPGGEGFTLSNDLFILDESLLGEDGLGF